MKTGPNAVRDDLAVELVTGLDQVPLPPGPRGLRRTTKPRAGLLGMPVAALVGAGVVVAIAFALVQLDPDVGQRAGAPQETGVVASPTAKTDPTPVPTPTGTIAPQHLRLYWVYLEDRQVMVFENESQKVTAVRVVTLDGRELASATMRPPEPGEPRTCGHPNVIKPLVAVMPVPPEVAAEFKSGSPQFPPTDLANYRVEAQQADGLWHTVAEENLLNRNNVAGAPCYQ